jgi:hypothetical protein
MIVNWFVIVCVVSKLVLMFGFLCLLDVLARIVSVYGVFSDVAGWCTGENVYILQFYIRFRDYEVHICL